MPHLIAKVYQDVNYGGQYRWIYDNISNFHSTLGFGDRVSSIRVYAGNLYTVGDTMRFYENTNYDGGYLELGPGNYPNIHIHPFNFGDKISSVDAYVQPPSIPGIIVRLRIILYKDKNYGGESREILTNEHDLSRIGFNNMASSLRIFQGEDYAANWVCEFYDNINHTGGSIGPYEAGTNIQDLAAAPYNFNDQITSVRIYLRS